MRIRYLMIDGRPVVQQAEKLVLADRESVEGSIEGGIPEGAEGVLAIGGDPLEHGEIVAIEDLDAAEDTIDRCFEHGKADFSHCCLTE